MKHFYKIKKAATAWMVLLLVSLFALPSMVAAQVSFRDDFEYPEGNLLGQGGWMHFGSNPNDPIQVVKTPLTYPGYYEKADGKSVRLGDAKSAEDLMVRFAEEDASIKKGNFYFSALINVEKQPTGKVYSLSLLTRTKRIALEEGNSPNEFGRIFFAPADNTDEVKIGVERGGANPAYATEPLKLGKTYLVVMRYEINATEQGKDNVYLYVNPASFKSEPTTPSAVIDGINHTGGGVTNYGLQGIELRQGSTYNASAPVFNVASVRVSDTYGGLFGQQAEDTTPTFKASKKSLILGSVYTGNEYSEDLTITGANLTGDISVESSSPAVTVTPAQLSKADVMSGDGAKLNVKVVYTEGTQNATLTLKSEGAKDVIIKVSWDGFSPAAISTLKALYSENPEAGTTYRYSGEATVLYVDKGSEHATYYLQDATAGISVVDEYDMLTSVVKAGDRITGTIFGLQKSFGTLYAVPFNVNMGKVLSKGNTVEPVEVSLADLKAAPQDYVAKLVKVKGVKFKDVAENAVFAQGMQQPIVTDGTNEAKVRIFKNTTLIGKSIPTDEVELTGILTSASETQLIIAPRGADDVAAAAQGPASFDVTLPQVGLVAGFIGKTVEAANIHISAKNLPAPILLELTGAGSKHFSLSTSKIEKGSSETDVIVFYTPTTVAKHKANLLIDCAALPELSQTLVINAYAIDEKNPPKATLNPTALAKFEAKANETQEQTLEITTSGLPDFGKIAVKTPGVFRLNNTMLMKAAKNVVKVTFAPTAAGTFDNALIISALGMEDIVVPIQGVATEGTQTDPTKEGDDFALSTASPVKLLNETFDKATDRNKPFKFEGWTNTAIKGTRAWWGYSFTDNDESVGENVAKVTPYDSKVADGEETPMEVLLVTPALDFKNAKSKMFTFRVRGDYLQDGQTDKLELCYLDMQDNEPYVQPVDLVLPCTKDQSGEWYEYHLDLAEYDLPDVMFMGFKFTGTRGRLNSATYYVDDVTYGRTDIPVIRPSVLQLAFTAQVDKDAMSDVVKVTTENLAEPVKLSLGGANKSKFKLSASSLDAAGGSFSVAFNSSEVGVHEAYVKLASRGAADKFIALSVNNTVASGIATIPADAARIVVYDLAGHIVVDKAQATPSEAVNSLAKGVYVVKVIGTDSISTYKVKL